MAVLSVLEEVEAFCAYLSAKESSRHTLRAYRRNVFDFLTAVKVAPKAVTRQVLLGYQFKLSKAGAQPRTIRRAFAAISSFFKFLIYSDRLKTNPCLGLIMPKVSRRLPVVLSVEEIDRMLAMPTSCYWQEMDRIVVSVLWATGARLGELAAATAEDLNLKDSTLRVIGKGNREAALMLTPKTSDLLTTYLEHRPASKYQALLLDISGAAYGVNRIYASVRRCARRAGITKRVHPHLIRHSIATAMLERGCELRVIQEFLRHKNISTTTIYAQVSTARLRSEYTKFHPQA